MVRRITIISLLLLFLSAGVAYATKPYEYAAWVNNETVRVYFECNANEIRVEGRFLKNGSYRYETQQIIIVGAGMVGTDFIVPKDEMFQYRVVKDGVIPEWSNPRYIAGLPIVIK